MGEVKSDELMVGNPTEMSVSIYNTGKDNLNTFMCDVIGKGIKIDNDQKFIGNFNTGTQETFSFTATPTREGEIEGQIMLSYEDSTGKVHTQIKDFSKEVSPGMLEDMEAGVNGEMGEEMGVGRTSIYKIIRSLKELNILEYVGRKNQGKWVVKI